MIAKFYMRGGHVVVVKNVENLTTNSNMDGSGFSGYKIEWKPGAKIPLLSLALQDIVAVTVEKTFWGT